MWNQPWSAFAFLQVTPLRDCHLRTQQTLRKYASNYVRSVAKQYIPHGCCKNYVPCWWDKECETLCCTFLLQAPVWNDSVRATLSLLSRPEQKRLEQWEEAVNSINFFHSSHKAWSTINKLRGRSVCSSCLCPASSNSITWELVKNGAHKTGSCESTRLINKELSDLWEVQTLEGSTISVYCFGCRVVLSHCLQFSQQNSLPSSIAWNQERFYFPRVYTPHWLGFQILALRFTHGLIVVIPKLEKLLGDPKSYCPISLRVTLSILARLIHLCQTNHWPITPAGTSMFSTCEVSCRSGHSVDTGHQEYLFS